MSGVAEESRRAESRLASAPARRERNREREELRLLEVARKARESAARNAKRQLADAAAAVTELARHRTNVKQLEDEARAHRSQEPDYLEDAGELIGFLHDEWRAREERRRRKADADAAERVRERSAQRNPAEQREARIAYAVDQVRLHVRRDELMSHEARQSIDQWLGPLAPDEREEAELRLAEVLGADWIRRPWA